MRSHVFTLCIAATLAAQALAGSFGPGPWANGAYYPGQFDGVYSASIYGSNGISGVLGFALQNGAPTTSASTSTSTDSALGGLYSSSTTLNSTGVDAAQNYFVVFVEGRTFAGLSTASINADVKTVAGALYSGKAPSTTQYLITENIFVNTNGTTNITQLLNTVTIENTCGGGFTADVTSDGAIISFLGIDNGVLTTSTNGVPTEDTNGVIVTNIFSINGVKVANFAASGATQSSAQ